MQDKRNASFSLILAASNKEESELNEKLIRRYGVPKSRTLTSSVFMAPIGQEHYELFEPLTGTFHDSVQQALGLREEGEKEKEEASHWCTRCVLFLASKCVFLARISHHTILETAGVCLKSFFENSGVHAVISVWSVVAK